MISQALPQYYKNNFLTISEGLGAVSEVTIEPTSDTPFIRLSPLENQLIVKGASTREDIHVFYDPMMRKLKRYLEGSDHFSIRFFFKKMNTSTTKVLFNIFKVVSHGIQSGKDITVYWGAEREDNYIYEIGKDLAELYDIEFQYYELAQNEL